MWGVFVAVTSGLVLGGLGTLGMVMAYAKRHPGLLIHAAFEYGLDQPESGDGDGDSDGDGDGGGDGAETAPPL